MDEATRNSISEEIISAIQSSMVDIQKSINVYVRSSMAEVAKHFEELKTSLMKISTSIDEVCLQQQFLDGEIQNLTKENPGNVQYPSLQSNEMGRVEVNRMFDEKSVEKESVHEMFDEMSKRKILEQKASVQEYYEVFKSLFGQMCLDEIHLTKLFIWGLQPGIKERVSMFKPKILYDAYCLAKLQESTMSSLNIKSDLPLLLPTKSQGSSKVKENMGLVIFHEFVEKNDESSKVELLDKENPTAVYLNDKKDNQLELVNILEDLTNLTNSHVLEAVLTEVQLPIATET